MGADFLLTPGRRLLERLSFFHKFLLVGLLFLVPMAVLLTTLASLWMEGIERTQREQEGIRLIVPMRQAIHALQIHRGASQIVIGGRKDATDKVENAAKRVSQIIDGLSAPSAFDAALVERYGLRSVHAGIGAAWKDLRDTAVTMSSEDSLALHSNLIRNLLGHIDEVADKTGLSLDAEVETSHLARALYDHLLDATESAGVMRAMGSRALTLGTMTAEERIHVRRLLDGYRQSMARAMTAFDKSIAANPALADHLKASFEHLPDTYGAYSDEIRGRLLETGKPTGNPAAYFETATRAIDAVFALWDVAIKQLDSRLEQRIQQLRHDLLVNILIAAIAAGLSIYLFIAFMQSVNREISLILEGTDRIASGDFSHAIVSDVHDEIGEICRRLDHVRIQLVVHIELDRQATEERALKEAAVQSGMRLRTILDNLGEGIYVLDEEGRLTYLNAAAEALLGWRFEELEGKEVHDIIHHHTPDGRPLPSTECPIYLAMRSGRIYRSDNEMFFTRDGTPLPVSVTGAPLLLDDRKNGSVAAFRDMRAQRALIDKMAEAQGKLYEAKEQAETAARMKSEFLSMMSHEIRTPLNGVIGMTDFLLDTPLDAEQQEIANITKTSAQQLLAVINDILDFSRIEAGRLVIEKIPFDFPLLVENSVDLVTAKAREKGLTLSCFVDPSIPVRLTGDPARLRQILVNFLGNAVKFTAQGEIGVRATRGAPNDETTIRVRLEVTDSGIGIEQDALDRLFKPFSQADASTTRKYGGTGLGLSISKRLAELMDGDVGVESVPGHGSTFWLELNIPPAHEGDPLPRMEDIRGLRLIVAGGSDTTRTVLESYTRAWGVDVYLAASLDDARTRVAEGTDMLLLAEPLPETTMEDALASLHAANIPLLACLAQPRTGQRALMESLGVADMLTCPVKQSVLFNALLTALHSKASCPPLSEDTPMPVTTDTVPSPHEGIRILLAEDNAVNQKVAVRLLGKLGYHVDIANNGREALHLWRMDHYNLILMDVQMPGMDGFEATSAIRGLEANEQRHTPIIAMTANAMSGDRERCLTSGMDDYLSKPIDPARLQAVLEAWLPVDESPPPPPPATDATPFDMARLEEFFGSDEESIMELLEVFATSLPSLQGRLKLALKERNTALKGAAHELKGSAANIGATRLGRLAARLEELSTAGNWPEADETFTAIEAEIGHVEAFVRRRHP